VQRRVELTGRQFLPCIFERGTQPVLAPTKRRSGGSHCSSIYQSSLSPLLSNHTGALCFDLWVVTYHLLCLGIYFCPLMCLYLSCHNCVLWAFFIKYVVQISRDKGNPRHNIITNEEQVCEVLKKNNVNYFYNIWYKFWKINCGAQILLSNLFFSPGSFDKLLIVRQKIQGQEAQCKSPFCVSLYSQIREMLPTLYLLQSAWVFNIFCIINMQWNSWRPLS
jgi:hypothetical protein